jgi:hypothetical protein
MQLWADCEVRELLLPSTMRLQALLDRARLQDFLASSKKPVFPWDEQWMRLLTAEYVLHVLEKSGVGILS